MTQPRIAGFSLYSSSGSCLFFGRAIGFWKSTNNTSQGAVSNYPMCSYFSWWSSSHSPCIHSCVANCDEWRSSQLISYADSLWRTPHDWLLRLHEYPGDLVRLSCEKCGRSGQYRKQKLIDRPRSRYATAGFATGAVIAAYAFRQAAHTQRLYVPAPPAYLERRSAPYRGTRLRELKYSAVFCILEF